MEITVNDELIIVYPDCFRFMNDSDMQENEYLGGKPDLFLFDKKDRVILTVGMKKVGIIIAKLLSLKEVAKRMESFVRKSMQPFNYSFKKYVSKNIGAEPARGFLYEYEAKQTEMSGTFYVVKGKKTFYYINYYGHRELSEKNDEIWKEIRLKKC